MMLTISLDEYGQFENEGNAPRLIGGAVYVCNPRGSVEEQAAEQNAEKYRIADYLERCCLDCGALFPQDLHFEKGNPAHNEVVKRVKDRIKSTFRQEFLPGAKGRYYFYAILSEGRGVTQFSSDEGNMLADNFGINRYLHMSAQVLRNLLIDNPVVSGDSYQLELATRMYEADVDKKKELKSFGLSTIRKKAQKKVLAQGATVPTDDDDLIFFVTTDLSYVSALSAITMDRGISGVNYKMRTQSINYSPDSGVEKLQGYLYLADVVCSFFEDVIKSRDGSRQSVPLASRLYEEACRLTGHRDNMIWSYGDIDFTYRTALLNLADGDLFTCLSLLYDVTLSNSNAAVLYREFWVEKALARMRRDCSALDLTHAAQRLAEYMDQNRTASDQDRAEYIANQLLSAAGGTSNDSRYAFDLYHCLAKLFNHRGLSEKAQECFEKAMQSARSAPIGDYMELRNAYSVSLSDQLRYTEALAFAEETDQYEELIEEIRKGLSGGAYEDISIRCGRTKSQLGQCLAFLGRYEEAAARFEKAFALFGDDEKEKQQTRSYLLHSLIEAGNQECYEREAALYFGAEDRLRQIEAVCRDDNTAAEFAIYVYVKAWRRFYLYETSRSNTERLLKVIQTRQRRSVLRHPWELISKYCALIAEDKRLSDSAEFWSGILRKCTSENGLVGRIARDGLEEFNCLREGLDYSPNRELTYTYH